MLKTPLRYLHTLRYLRPIQIYGRLRFRLARPRPDLRSAPPLRSKERIWQPAACREPSLTAPTTFLFLGRSAELEVVGWDGTAMEKLWRYNQHYFDDLNAIDASRRTAWHGRIMRMWVEQNPPGVGTGWEPYPTSLRIVNWVKSCLSGHSLPAECLQSLAVQARWLRQRLEVHLLGNHLFANAKALIFAGLFFAGEEAQSWLESGLHILEREVAEQVLDDGGHFERSTMYHALALEDMLDLINILTCYEAALSPSQQSLLTGWRARTATMWAWLHTMCHPDGEIAFFNDAAFGIAPSRSELDAYAKRLGISANEQHSSQLWMKSSGYIRLEQPRAVAFLDVAPVGPDYLPGHAHADTLSFELSLHGRRLLVNSGTSCYGSSRERLRQRGTAAHNTVLVGNEDSSEVWSGFRVARRARPFGISVQAEGTCLLADASHDGYTRLAGKPVHHRRWELRPDTLIVEDTVLHAPLQSQALFHFHPDALLFPIDGARRGTIRMDGQIVAEWWIATGDARVEANTWHPRFGEAQPNQCLKIQLVNGICRFQLTWTT